MGCAWKLKANVPCCIFILSVVSLGINITVFVLNVQGWLEYENRVSYELVDNSTFWYIIKPGVNISSCSLEAQLPHHWPSRSCGDDISLRHENIETTISLSDVNDDFQQTNDRDCERDFGVAEVYRHIIKKDGNQWFFAITFWITLLIAIILNLLNVLNQCCGPERSIDNTDTRRWIRCLEAYAAFVNDVMSRTTIVIPTYLISAFDFSRPCL